MKRFLIAEGEADIALLKMLIPAERSEGVKFVVGGGYSAAISLASSILYDKPDSYISLVLDADTADPSSIQEKYDFINWQLGKMSANRSYDIHLFIPASEALFINYGMVKTRQKISFDPKATLKEALDEKGTTLLNFINALSPVDVKALSQDQTVQNIIRGLHSEVAQV
ncbi:MAG: hypothetical protein WA960_16470 [Tunicatimonas sp.]